MPLEVAAGAEPDPSIVAAFLERGDLMTTQLAQRLRVDAKNSRHCGGGHPISFEHGALGSEPLRTKSSSKRRVLRHKGWATVATTLSQRSLVLDHQFDNRRAQIRVTSNPDGFAINVDCSGSALLLFRHCEGS